MIISGSAEYLLFSYLQPQVSQIARFMFSKMLITKKKSQVRTNIILVSFHTQYSNGKQVNGCTTKRTFP